MEAVACCKQQLPAIILRENFANCSVRVKDSSVDVNQSESVKHQVFAYLPQQRKTVALLGDCHLHTKCEFDSLESLIQYFTPLLSLSSDWLSTPCISLNP